jgi:hypothetical protein
MGQAPGPAEPPSRRSCRSPSGARGAKPAVSAPARSSPDAAHDRLSAVGRSSAASRARPPAPGRRSVEPAAAPAEVRADVAGCSRLGGALVIAGLGWVAWRFRPSGFTAHHAPRHPATYPVWPHPREG